MRTCDYLWKPATCAVLMACLIAGCKTPATNCTQGYVNQASVPVDLTPPPVSEATSSTQLISGEQQSPSGNGNLRFDVPPELPGANAPRLESPGFDTTLSTQERRSALETLFPEISETEITTSPVPANSDRPLTLATLQQLAVDNSPVIRQAAADVEKLRGKAVQAGLYPNPTVGFESDTFGTAGTAGYNGVYFTQEFVTAGKLDYARSAAQMSVQEAVHNLQKSRITLASDIRRGYFRVLVAQEQVKFNKAVLKLANEVYQAQIDLVAGGEAAAYEPLQLRVFAIQAKNSLIRADNNLTGRWRELTAVMGLPGMGYQAVEGDVEMPIPKINYEAAAAILLTQHTDLAAVRARIASTQYNLKLQQITPIPNIEVYAALQHDDTTSINNTSGNFQIGIPVPLYNRNQGNISTANAELIRAHQDLTDTQNTLQQQLAEIFNRYDSSRVITQSYRNELLSDQVRVYRGIYERFRIAGDGIDFAQVVVAQQTLSTLVGEYLQSLEEQWIATVDLAELLQVNDLLAMGELVGEMN